MSYSTTIDFIERLYYNNYGNNTLILRTKMEDNEYFEQHLKNLILTLVSSRPFHGGTLIMRVNKNNFSITLRRPNERLDYRITTEDNREYFIEKYYDISVQVEQGYETNKFISKSLDNIEKMSLKVEIIGNLNTFVDGEFGYNRYFSHNHRIKKHDLYTTNFSDDNNVLSTTHVYETDTLHFNAIFHDKENIPFYNVGYTSKAINESVYLDWLPDSNVINDNIIFSGNNIVWNITDIDYLIDILNEVGKTEKDIKNRLIHVQQLSNMEIGNKTLKLDTGLYLVLRFDVMKEHFQFIEPFHLNEYSSYNGISTIIRDRGIRFFLEKVCRSFVYKPIPVTGKQYILDSVSEVDSNSTESFPKTRIKSNRLLE